MTQGERANEREAVRRLVREILERTRSATSVDVERIIAHIAGAPFNDQVINVPAEHHGRDLLGTQIGPRANSLTVHLLTRIFINEQWRLGTTPEEYLADIRAAMRHESARPLVYERRGGTIVGILSENVTPLNRRGKLVLPLLYSVYSIDRDSIISAYQASNVQAIPIPGDALWLR